ncbi:MAG TPA: PaaX family transcriptional regulator C-terminal domain-containing protein [Candidatus Paceibacterota bacterium]|nr:PaaX family transcriptional regulator C-terminal domain-containing protein [Candidatus Paceibacterota bacterium]HSA02802.1 PaaX family transcriptional regulator C-terminal domain-containing protein [Candidatus Paceibacterota bacterium]
MSRKTEELLAMLIWTGDILSRPTWRNFTDSFESWAYRNGLSRQLQRLEKQDWLERREGPAAERLLRLTEAGRQRALGGHDPVVRWNRPWDGRWRMVLFDVPESHNAVRDSLRRSLRDRGFGYLQNSVWITPDPLESERVRMEGASIDIASLTMFEGRPCGGERDEDIVAGAWDFDAINARYRAHEKVLASRPQGRLNTEKAAGVFHRWIGEEQRAWLQAVRHDPLLPACLLPRDYAGRKAWDQRLETMSEAGEQMRQFRFVRETTILHTAS